VSAERLGYRSDLDFVFPSGIAVFRAPGGLQYHHGGVSLQEIVVPVLSFRVRPTATAPEPQGKVRILDAPAEITNRTFGIRVLASADLFADTPVSVRIVLIHKSEQVGEAGMAMGAVIDRATGLVRLRPGEEASVGLMLTREDCELARIVVLDAVGDALLAQSADIPIRLGIRG